MREASCGRGMAVFSFCPEGHWPVKATVASHTQVLPKHQAQLNELPEQRTQKAKQANLHSSVHHHVR